MKSLFLLTLLIVGIFQTQVFSTVDQLVHLNGLMLYTDLEKPGLPPEESAVFPYSDEARILFKLASEIKDKAGKEFSLVIDPFCGDGKSGLLIVFHQIAKRIIGSDINLRAIQYARKNASVNQLETKSRFFVRDIKNDEIERSNISGKCLWIANPPFALKAEGTDLDLMRDGGENGLLLTNLFVTQALKAAKSGDVILGISYSRISTDGIIELEQELKNIVLNYGGELQVILLDSEKLWRGYNGKKEQTNPMPISEKIFALKADPLNQDEVSKYHKAAKLHNMKGFNKLGYYAYVIYR